MKHVAFFVALLLSFLFFSFNPQALADGTYSNPGTGDANDCSSDCLTWSQSPVWIVDSYGKFIITTQNRTGPTTHFAFSNDSGSTWTQSTEGYSFLTRGSMAYDSNNDVIHMIWNATDSNDGIIYRRYSITRDGSNNITSVQRMNTGVNLQLDTSSSRSFEHPIAIWKDDGTTNGILIAGWVKMGSSLVEVRFSMRRLSMTDADGVAGNWIALDGTGDTFSTDPPAVAADKVFGSTGSGSTGVAAKIRGGSGAHKDDLYIFPATSISSVGSAVLGYRMAWSSGSNNFSGGTTDLGTIGQIDNTGGGYNLKWQLISKPVIDTTNDRLYIGWARWKTGGDGDTVSFAYLNSADSVSSTIDAYSALGTHSYAPTLDISFDNTGDNLYVAYLTSTTNGANGSILYKTYDGSSLSTATTFYTSPGGSAGEDGSGDIPQMMEDRLTSNDRIYIGFRVNGALPPTGADPHTLRLGYIQLAAPTPTPTATPTPSASSNNSSSNSAPGPAGPPACNDQTPASIPDLFQIDPAGTFVQLHFTTVNGASGYKISYGLNQNDSQYSDQFPYSGPQWTYSRVIGGLNPNTTYSFKIQAVNGCTAGSWSKTVTVKTKGRLADLTSKLASLNPFAKPPTPPGQAPAKPSSCIYTVQPGDSLWKIAQNVLGSGTKFSQIITSNPDIFTSGISGSIIKVGWKLKVC